MAILTTSYVGQSFGAADIFSGVSVSIPNDGKIGLVGPNGIGKTSLLLILARLRQPTMGSVHVAGGTRVGYLSQESSETFAGQEHTVYEEMLTVFATLRADEARLRQMETRMASDGASDELLAKYSKLQERFERAGGYDYEVQIKQVLDGLGFSDSNWHLPLTHLSGGQKTRALLARLLLEEPDLLILDEPTNHLDVAAIEWLEGVLHTWPGAVLVVSHDRYFLDKVVNTIWEMNRKGIESYRGNYSAYVQQRQERWERQEKTFAALMERLHKEMDYIRRNMAGQRTQMAQGKLSRLAREVEAIHAGGLGVVQALKSKGWARVQANLDVKRPPATVSELHQRINELQGPTQPPVLNFKLQPSHRSGDIVLRTLDLEIGYPGTSLFTADAIELHRQECAALIGPNGTGKTTFLRTILGQMEPLSGEIKLGASLKMGYFSQTHERLNLENRVLDELLDHRNMPISEARNYLARYLFRGDDVYQKISTLSGGERGRLALAILALENANFLLLDEPTNHLDIPAQEALQAVLEQYGGTILMVSHDRYLVDRLATQIWVLRDGRLHVYKGDYQHYLAQRDREAEVAAAAAEKAAAVASPQPDSNGEKPGLSKNERRLRAAALAELEGRIVKEEETLKKLTHALQEATQAQTFEKIQSLSEEYAAAESRLEHLLDKWENMANE